MIPYEKGWIYTCLGVGLRRGRGSDLERGVGFILGSPNHVIELT